MILYARADSPVVSWLADSILPTLLIEARVLAFSIIACFRKRTFIVISTASWGKKQTHLQADHEAFSYQAMLTLSADLVGVSNEASPAATRCSVAVHLAHSIHAACQRRARVLALFLDAG